MFCWCVLSKNNVNQLFIEGGGETAWEFIKQKLVDEVNFFVAPLMIGGRDAKTPIEGDGFKTLAKAMRTGPLQVIPAGSDIIIRTHLRKTHV